MPRSAAAGLPEKSRYNQAMAARDLLAEALGLPPAERGRIVRELILSLDHDEAEDPAEVERAWAAELEHRATQALRGDSTARDLNATCDRSEPTTVASAPAARYRVL